MRYNARERNRSSPIPTTIPKSKSIYSRLQKAGFSKSYLSKVAALPDWWDDTLWDDPPGRAEGYIHLSRHLGIDIQSLQDEKGPLRLKDFGVCKYKKQAGTTDDELLLSRVIATRAAHFAIAATVCTPRSIPAADELRESILDNHSWVGFPELIDWCWSSGIPVIHVNNFPSTATKKPMGFTLRSRGRPAIVLCAEKKQPAWQLFVLAHELAHLCLGHVPEDGALLDERVEGETDIDSEETLADNYALSLLTGAEMQFHTGNNWPSAAKLAEQAQSFGQRNRIDPGHVILNCAKTVGGDFWRIAQSALKLLSPDTNAIEMIGRKMVEHLDWERLPEDDSAFLMRVTRRENTK